MPDEIGTAGPARAGGEDRIPRRREALGALAPPQPVGALAAHPRRLRGLTDAPCAGERRDELRCRSPVQPSRRARSGTGTNGGTGTGAGGMKAIVRLRTEKEQKLKCGARSGRLVRGRSEGRASYPFCVAPSRLLSKIIGHGE